LDPGFCALHLCALAIASGSLYFGKRPVFSLACQRFPPQLRGLFETYPRGIAIGDGSHHWTLCHDAFVDHALGLISVRAQEEVRLWVMALWRSPPGPATSLWQLVTHATIALYVLMRRRHYYMPAWEGVQVLPGLTIPDLLLVHIVNTRGARVLTGIDIDYTYGSRTCGSIPGRGFARSRSYCWFGDILQWACIFGDVYMAGPGERFRRSWSCLS